MFKTIVGALGGEDRRGLPPPGNGPGHLRQLQERAGQHPRAASPSASPRSARASATRSRRGTSPSAPASSSRWRSSSSATPASRSAWYQYWRDRRYQWYLDLGLAGDRLAAARPHARRIEPLFGAARPTSNTPSPSSPRASSASWKAWPIAAISTSAATWKASSSADPSDKKSPLVVEKDAEGKPRHRGSGKDLNYFDDQTKERFIPHVIEPSAGADRATLAFLCQAYTEDEVPDENGKADQAGVAETPSPPGPDQGGRLPAGEEGRHAGGGQGNLLGPEAAS